MKPIHQLLLLCGAAYCAVHMVYSPFLAGLPALLRWGIALAAAGLLAFLAAPRLGVCTALLIYLCGFFVLFDLLQLLFSRAFSGTPFYAGWAAIYRQGLLPLLLAALITLAGFLNARTIRTTQYTIPLSGLQGAPVRIALVTDLHAGTVYRAGELPRVLAHIQALEADAILLGGDFIDENSTPGDIQALLEGLPTLRAPLGVYYVPGNHEYRAMRESGWDLRAAFAQLEAGGIHPLPDQAVPLGDRLTLIGRNDAGGTSVFGRKSLAELLAQAGAQQPVIVLDHRPEGHLEAAALGVSLHLSGHTHNGQLFPINMLYNFIHKYEMMYGHRQRGEFHAIVSSGIGAWGFAQRTMSRSEVVVITLVPGGEGDGAGD